MLAVDTAARSCSVGIIEDDAVLTEKMTCVFETHAVHVMVLVTDALKAARLPVSAIDIWAAVRGPGSFTGLRIGLSTVMGLAAAARKPAVGVSSLAVLAMQCRTDRRLLCPLLDARKSEVYSGRYRWRKGRLILEAPEQVGSLAQALDGIDEPCLFVGDAALARRKEIAAQSGFGAEFAAAENQFIRASVAARLALQQAGCDAGADAAALVPNYIRRSDVGIH